MAFVPLFLYYQINKIYRINRSHRPHAVGMRTIATCVATWRGLHACLSVSALGTRMNRVETAGPIEMLSGAEARESLTRKISGDLSVKFSDH